MSVKFCEDCIHFRTEDDEYSGYCTNKQSDNYGEIVMIDDICDIEEE